MTIASPRERTIDGSIRSRENASPRAPPYTAVSFEFREEAMPMVLRLKPLGLRLSSPRAFQLTVCQSPPSSHGLPVSTFTSEGWVTAPVARAPGTAERLSPPVQKQVTEYGLYCDVSLSWGVRSVHTEERYLLPCSPRPKSPDGDAEAARAGARRPACA